MRVRLLLVAFSISALTFGFEAVSRAGVRSDSVRVGGNVMKLVSARGSLWALTCDQYCSGEARRSVGRVLRIDPQSGRILTSATLPDPGDLAVGAAGVFATDFWGSAVRRLDPVSLQRSARVPLTLPFEVAPGDNAFIPSGVTVDSGAVWVLTARGALSDVDPDSGRVVSIVRLPGDATTQAQAGAGAVWVSVSVLGVYRIDPQTHRVSARIVIGRRDHRLAVGQVVVGENKVFAVGTWTQSGVLTAGNALARIDPAHPRNAHVTELPPGPLLAAYGAGSLWIARPRSSEIDRIDPNTGRIVARLGGKTNGALTISGGDLWTASPNGVIRRVAIP